MIKYFKIILLLFSFCILGFSINLAIKNYEIRIYLKQTYDSLKNDTITPDFEKLTELQSVFYGSYIPDNTKKYSIKEIGEVLKNGFSYFTGIKLNDMKIKYNIGVYDRENNIHRYFKLSSTDTTNANFIITPML